jgi:two-component system sensor histidine kinase RegB
LPQRHRYHSINAMGGKLLQKREIISVEWILRMRWMAAIGQILCAIVGQSAYDLVVPWAPVLVIITITIVSNLLFVSKPHLAITGTPLWLDVFLLTGLIYFTGGSHNPFTSFYLLHIALAAMTMSRRALWSLVATTIIGYTLIFFWHKPLLMGDMEISSGCASYSWHLQGMLYAFIVTAIFIAAFVSRMHRILIQQDAELEKARIKAEKNAQFAALATFSAGVAHELGSPLATISLASSELVFAFEKQPELSPYREDAQLIAQEVKRCRHILDRLNERHTQSLGDLPRSTSLHEIIDTLHQTLPEALMKRVHISEHPQFRKKFILPRDSVTQAIAILLNNAHQADPTTREIKLDTQLSDTTINITVADQGNAPSADILERASDPFFTTKQPGEGMGLGLFLVKNLAMHLGGDFQLTRSSDGWTSAHLTISRNSDDQEL